MDENNQPRLTEQMLDGMDFPDDEIELTQDTNVQGFAKLENDNQKTGSTDLDEEEVEQNIEPGDFDEEQFFQSFETIDTGEEEIGQKSISTAQEAGENRENPGRQLTELEQQLLDGMDYLEDEIHLTQEPYPGYTRPKDEIGLPADEEGRDIIRAIADKGRATRDALENGRVDENAETDPNLEAQMDSLEELIEQYENGQSISEERGEILNSFRFINFALENDEEQQILYIRLSELAGRAEAKLFPEEQKKLEDDEKKPSYIGFSEFEPDLQYEAGPENAEAGPENAEMTLERFNAKFAQLLTSFDNPSDLYQQIPVDGSKLNTEQKLLQIELFDLMKKARTALREGPEDTDPESMLKWCESVSILSGRHSQEMDYYHRAGLGNGEKFLTPGDELRMQVAEKWISLFNDFPEQRANLFEYNGVSKIEKPDEIISVVSGRHLPKALDELDESYERAHFAREFEKSSSWSRANAAPEEKPALVSLDGNAAKSFKFVVQDDYLRKLNTGELTKQLQDLQKELKATDPFWVWTNTERFTKLKDTLSTTLKSLEQYEKKRFQDEWEKDREKESLLAEVSLLAKAAEGYSNVKAGDYASSNKSRDLRRGQAAAKILAFTSAYVVNEKVEAMGKAFMECKEACEAKDASQTLLNAVSQNAANDMLDAVRTAMSFPAIPGCQDKLALAYTNTARLPIGIQFGQRLEKNIRAAITGDKDGNSITATREQKLEIERINGELNTLKSRAVQVQKTLAAKARRTPAPANKPAPDKSKDLKGMGKN